MGHINSLVIKNFKGFKDFEVSFNEGMNIIVGNNNVGKSTILEAVHLAFVYNHSFFIHT